MAQSTPKILFLCTGNSARSIFAEYLTKKICPDRFEAYSAGSKPTAVVNPYALQVLREQYKIDAQNARSKSWDEFRDTNFDIIITVCDRAKETCPIFPGRPLPIGAFRIRRRLPEPTYRGSECLEKQLS